MIPSTLEYTKATSLDEALAAVKAGARPLAGGMSLMPMMRLRLAAPGAVVDLGGVPELVGICEDGDEIAIGAMTTHRSVANDPLIREHCHVVAQAAAGVGSMTIRNRGTIGGSLAHADPHGDLHAAILLAYVSSIHPQRCIQLLSLTLRLPVHLQWPNRYLFAALNDLLPI